MGGKRNRSTVGLNPIATGLGGWEGRVGIWVIVVVDLRS